MKLNLGFRLTAAAGSDTPWGSTIGEVRTYVHTGAQFDVDTWFRNLKAGHTFVINGRPTWNARRGPGIIEKQLAAIAKIEAEFAHQDDARAKGLRERLERARSFYGDLGKNMAG